MKRLRDILLIPVFILLLLYMAIGAPCTIDWNPAPGATTYQVWRGLDLLATTQQPTATVDLPTDRLSTLTVRALNTGGPSPHSQPITVMPVQVQHSADLTDWHPGPLYFAPHTPRFFTRSRYLTHP